MRLVGILVAVLYFFVSIPITIGVISTASELVSASNTAENVIGLLVIPFYAAFYIVISVSFGKIVGALLSRFQGPLLALFAVVMMAPSCARVEPGYVGIVVDSYGDTKGVSNTVRTTGMHWINPFTQSLFEYPTFSQTVSYSAPDQQSSFNSRDSVSLQANVTLTYRIDAGSVPKFYEQFRDDRLASFTNTYMLNAVRAALVASASQMDAQEIIGARSNDFMELVRKETSARISGIGVVVEQLNLGQGVIAPDSLREAISQKVRAREIAVQKENELQSARADAEKLVAAAQGQRRANEELERGLTRNILHLRAIERWDGRLPAVYGGSAAMPMLDVSTLVPKITTRPEE